MFVTLIKYVAFSDQMVLMLGAVPEPVKRTAPKICSIPSNEECEKAGITVVQTGFHHNDMRDTGPDSAKESIQGMLDKFLADTDAGDVTPVETKASPLIEPGPVALYAPVSNEAQLDKKLTH